MMSSDVNIYLSQTDDSDRLLGLAGLFDRLVGINEMWIQYHMDKVEWDDLVEMRLIVCFFGGF